MTEIFRTVFQVEVFSQGPFRLQETWDENTPSDLEQISYAIDEGDCIGQVSKLSEAPVPAQQVQSELVRIGNDGSFFDFGIDADDQLDQPVV